METQLGSSPDTLPYAIVTEYQRILIMWYACYGRPLAWRVTDEPYRVLVAEFLLQKTDATKAQAVYEDFVSSWPSPSALANACMSELASVLRPLGLHYRARRLRAVAGTIMQEFGGIVPPNEADLLRLPGVGRYIASAVRCFAFYQPVAILDANVIRILGRAFGVRSDTARPRDDPQLWRFAQSLVPSHAPREYNWGLLDYGASVCRRSNPLCDNCALSRLCSARMLRKTGETHGQSSTARQPNGG